MTSREEIIWLAALLEGEGWFGLKYHAPQRKYVNLAIRLGMTDRDVVEHVARLFGCSVTTTVHQGGRKTMYFATVYGEKARWIMEQVLPYMGQRRSDKINELLTHPKSYQPLRLWEFYEACAS